MGIVSIGILNALKGIRRNLIRPPGAIEEVGFLGACIRCGKCLEICTYGSIKLAEGDKGIAIGTPFIVPRNVPCYLCMKCIEVCPTEALQKVKAEKVNMGKAIIDRERCYAWLGDVCRACYTNCPLPEKAIYFEEYTKVVVDEEKCVGCGICEYVCITEPDAAIKILTPEQSAERKKK